MARIHELVTLHFKESISVSKKMIQTYGTNAAVLIGELISKQRYWHDEGRLHNDRFYWSLRDITLTTGLSRKAIGKAVATLTDAGFIEVEAIPQKLTLYKVNIDAVERFLNETEVKRGKEFYHDTVSQRAQGYNMENPSVFQGTQGCVPQNTGAVSQGTHTNPFTNPDKPSVPSTEGSKGNTEVKELAGLYIQLFADKTGNKPYITQGKDHKILKTIINNQGLDKAKELMRKFFKQDDDFKRKAGYSIGLFSSNINSLLTTSKDGKMKNWTGASDRELYGYPEHRIIDS